MKQNKKVRAIELSAKTPDKDIKESKEKEIVEITESTIKPMTNKREGSHLHAHLQQTDKICFKDARTGLQLSQHES